MRRLHSVSLKLFLITITGILLSGTASAQLKLFDRNKPYFAKANKWIMEERIGITGGIGTSTYYGDLCDKFHCMKFRPNLGVGVVFRFKPNWYGKFDLNYFRLYSNDYWKNRNLNFRSGNVEMYMAAMYEHFPYIKHFNRRKQYSPYVFLGFGVAFYNPHGELNGKWHKLRPLKTEGKHYSSATPIIPFGVGLRIKHTKNLEFVAEAGYRITFTDYLDDVSSKEFKDPATFDNPTAAALSDKSPGTGEFKAPQRGNPDKNDGYFIFQVKARYTFSTNIAHFKGRHPKIMRKL
ncbi:MAG: DUF6089 family protein [Cytophagaceae bacterium]